MFDFEKDFTPNEIESDPREREIDTIIKLLMNAPIPEIKTDGMIFKAYRDLGDKIQALCAYGTHTLDDLDKKEELLHYLLLIGIGIDTYMEINNISCDL